MKKLNYLSTSQIMILHDLKSKRNTSRVLQEMSEYLHHFRDGENIYYLSAKGRERVNCKKVCKKTPQARHYIMRNSIYIAFGSPDTWRNEIKLGVKEDRKTHIIADALFIKDGRYHIVEVDYTQKMITNKQKIEKYKKLIECGVFQQKPFFIWITTTEYRRRELQKLMEGLDCQIFMVSDFI
ncbi:replication-relaxation family protein [Saccharococcus thermophilus]|uniref:replication-relaxation family protein n=1 Tax=Saccharococcus thermophilus TaxID=29396 RepID=UPI0036D3B0F2